MGATTDDDWSRCESSGDIKEQVGSSHLLLALHATISYNRAEMKRWYNRFQGQSLIISF